MLCTQLCSVRYTAIWAKNSMKSIAAIHPAITKNMENILVKRVPHISICESHYTSISAMLKHSKQGTVWEVPQQSLRLVLKPLRVYCKSSPYMVLKKSMEIKYCTWTLSIMLAFLITDRSKYSNRTSAKNICLFL